LLINIAEYVRSANGTLCCRLQNSLLTAFTQLLVYNSSQTSATD